MENSPPLLPNYDMPTLGTCFSSVFCSPWALNPISGTGWPYPLCSVSPSSSSSLSRRILHFRIQASSDIFHLITGGGGVWGSRGQPLTLPRLPSMVCNQHSWTEPGAQKGPTQDLMLCSTVWNLSFCFGFVFCKWRWWDNGACTGDLSSHVILFVLASLEGFSATHSPRLLKPLSVLYHPLSLTMIGERVGVRLVYLSTLGWTRAPGWQEAVSWWGEPPT